MHQAIPYRKWIYNNNPTTTTTTTTTSSNTLPIRHDGSKNSVRKMVSENPIIVFGRRGCCMCHVVKQLLLGHGVNPTVFEVDEEDEVAVIGELLEINAGELDGRSLQFTVVFVGGKVFGGLEKVMAAHISGELVPILKAVGALWL